MSRPRPAAPLANAPTTPDAPLADAVPTDAEIEAAVSAGEVTADVEGVETLVDAIDLGGSPPNPQDPMVGPTPVPTMIATIEDAPVAIERTRALIDVPVLALGAPGTIAKQDADGNWYAALPGVEPVAAVESAE